MTLLPYAGRVVVFGTRHGKEQQAAAPFRELLGAAVVAAPHLDTDRFGTFSGEVARTLAPLEAARAKARLALDATGERLALASEASYGPLPGVGWPGHEELLLFADAERGIEVVEGHRSLGVPGRSVTLRSLADLAPALDGADFPAQALIVRPEQVLHGSPCTESAGDADDAHQVVVKGITERDALEKAVVAVIALTGSAVVEPDLRAYHSPSRRAVLAALARTLAERLATPCPACGSPGFGRVDAVPGLPCEVCATPTELVAADVLGCAACPHRQTRPPSGPADPQWCPACNP